MCGLDLQVSWIDRVGISYMRGTGVTGSYQQVYVHPFLVSPLYAELVG